MQIKFNYIFTNIIIQGQNDLIHRGLPNLKPLNELRGYAYKVLNVIFLHINVYKLYQLNESNYEMFLYLFPRFTSISKHRFNGMIKYMSGYINVQE